MTLQFFIMGEPKSSMMMSMTKTEKPRPTSSGEPKGSATSPASQQVLPPQTVPGMGGILLCLITSPPDQVLFSVIGGKPTRS